MRTLAVSGLVVAAALAVTAVRLPAQTKVTVTGIATIPHEAVPNFFKNPPGIYTGENMGIATNSKGNIYIFHRANETRLFEYSSQGQFIREIGRGVYSHAFAHSVRVDAQDNIWTVDEGTNMITKFSPEGKVLMVLGRRPPAVDGSVVFPAGPNQPSQKYIFCRPTDVGFDPQGNIFVSDGYCNNRVVKFDKNGRFLAQVGSEKTGSGLGEFNLPHGLQVDEQGNVWVADRTNVRYQVLDNNLKPLREITNLGTGWTLCISPGPHQYVFHSNSNPNGNAPGTWDNTGEIYKTELDGTVIGRFGKPGKTPPGFQVVHMLDCRNPNELVLGEIESWRVQKYILQPSPATSQTTR